MAKSRKAVVSFTLAGIIGGAIALGGAGYSMYDKFAGAPLTQNAKDIADEQKARMALESAHNTEKQVTAVQLQNLSAAVGEIKTDVKALNAKLDAVLLNRQNAGDSPKGESIARDTR